jgi:type II secretory pathway pseudopilin PulG
MKLLNEAGFTIIETMLFLGITALLVMGVLIGTGNSINIQRYHDSVSSLQSFLQQQYSDVANVSNDSVGNLACYGSGPAAPRGQSDCVILGRFITTTDSHKLSIQGVVGYIPSGSTASLNDVNIFLKDGDGTQAGYNIQVSSVPSQTTTYDIEWGSSISDTAANHSNHMFFSMLVLRSPLSGILRTFIINTDNVGEIQSLTIQDLVKSSLTQKVEMCVDPNGLFTGARSAVVVMPNATGASSIETLGDVSGC